MIIGVVLVAALAVVALGTMTIPSTEAGPTSSPSTTTTRPTTTTIVPFDMSRAERGAPFVWMREVTLEENQVPIAMVEFKGATLFFTGESSGWGGANGMKSWTEDANGDWEALPSIDESYSIHGVIDSPFGLIAYGYESPNGNGMVWRSTDGEYWQPIVVAEGPGPEQTWWFDFAVASDDLVVISASAPRDYGSSDVVIRDALEAHFGPQVTYFFVEDYSADDPVVYVFGPLGVLIATVDVSEIGLSSADLENDFVADYTTSLWASDDGSTWVAHSDDETLATWGGFVSPEGQIQAHIESNRFQGDLAAIELVDGQITRTHLRHGADGSAWQQRGGWIVGQHFNGNPAISEDGLFWRQLDLRWLLGSPHAWWPTVMNAGPSGIVMAVETVEDGPVEPSPSVEWEGDGYRIRVTDQWIIVRDDARQAVLGRWGSDGSASVAGRLDPMSGVLTLLNPTTGEELISLEPGAVEQIELGLASLPDQSPMRLLRAFIFTSPEVWPVFPPASPDLTSGWTVQDLSPYISDADVTHLLIGSDRVFLAATGRGTNSELWVGLIPDQP